MIWSNAKKETKQDYVAANEDDYDAGRKSIAACDKISKIRRFKQLQENCNANWSLPAPKTTVAKVRQFMEQMLELMKCFDFLSSVMCLMEKQDEETI